MKYPVLFMFSLCLCGVRARCPPDAWAPLPFALEFALWRGWRQAVVYTPDLERGCQWAKIRLAKCLSVNGVASAFDPAQQPRVRTRLGVLVLMPRLKGNASTTIIELLKRLHEFEMNTAPYDWLLTVRSDGDFDRMNALLNVTSLRFDQNIAVGYPSIGRNPETRVGLCDMNFVYKKDSRYEGKSRNTFYSRENKCGNHKQRACQQYVREISYYRSTIRFKNLTVNKTYKSSGRILNLFHSGELNFNNSRPFEMTNISRFSLKYHFNRWNRFNRVDRNKGGVHIVQYFKVRSNSTLYACYLGFWSRDTSMSGVDTPFPDDVRNLLGEEIVVGRRNASTDGTPTPDDEGPSAPALLDDVLYFLTNKLNATPVTRYYAKLGFRTYEGSWTGLLGALMDQSVDLALEPVTAHPSLHNDMDFIFPIAETMCNIYIRQQETSTVRDIFMAPFSARLVACVVAVAFLAASAVVLISRLAPSVHNKARPMEYAEALIWSTGILCQQGGSWTPPNPAASILLIVCLLFAVVTYNAYAAFITSVLSVRVASLDTVAAVLQSPDLKIGYIRNGADQLYLMSTKDVQLNAFYIRGYSDSENLVSSAEEGLARAAKQNYAFFAGQRAARATLRNLSQARGRCAVRELPVHSTRAQLAFPLPHRSPYARPTLICLLQLHNTGALGRLKAALVPSMPECSSPSGFASARINDVRSALILVVGGLVAAFVIGLAEYCWKNRKALQIALLTYWRRLVNFAKLN
ncbi:uncharacterized protein LOC114361946 [Ostrinia furnacalis]|uniref:uncharacterized protein LOC114361946 n=1 Tax=Ostrinia furnacalis TaxID=93504 RepID=UPI00103C4E4D|nr:uncharacterized protein LOC114361946 [Ostrinia furnacalis]